MPDYSKGKMYKVLTYIDDEIYVGSTIGTLGQRMAKHRGSIKRNPHNKLYNHMNELGVNNFYIELIENFPCNDVYELRAREGHFIREIGTLNKNATSRTSLEYLEYKKALKEIEVMSEEIQKYDQTKKIDEEKN